MTYRKVGHKSVMSEGDATVISFRAVVRDGWYNAFTDLALWKNYWWLGYRRGTGHGAPLSANYENNNNDWDFKTNSNDWGGLEAPSTSGGNSFSVILRSTDLLRWHETKIFEPPEGIVDGAGIDEPIFCTTDNRLYAFIPVKWPGKSIMHCTWTEDGINWTILKELQLDGMNPYTWRVRYFNNKFYSVINGNNRKEGVLDLITSDDGINWSIHANITDKNEFEYTEETDIHLLPNGDMWTIIRTNSGGVFSSAKSPYSNWNKMIDLGVRCDAPVICKSGNKIYLAGRIDAPGETPRNPTIHLGTTGLYELTHGKTKLLLSFPPGGDAAYAGLVSPQPGRLVLSTYSDAAYLSDAIKPKHFPEYLYKKSESDIYIAEIDVTN